MGVKTEIASKLDRSIWTKASGKGFQHQFTSKRRSSEEKSRLHKGLERDILLGNPRQIAGHTGLIVRRFESAHRFIADTCMTCEIEVIRGS